MNRPSMRKLMALIVLVSMLPLTATAAEVIVAKKPTIILVHGAFAESASWSQVVSLLLADGYPVVAAANPLRGIKNDAEYLATVINSVEGPVVLVGHSYGGCVISNTLNTKGKIKALVYVAAFAPESGESAIALSGQFPGSTLGQALAPPVALPNGGNDLYILQSKFHEQFAADVPDSDARNMAATQRPVTDAALNEISANPLWKVLPSWFIYGTEDRNIPLAAHAFMAKRAGSTRTVEIEDGSHVIMVSHPKEVAKLISEAATA